MWRPDANLNGMYFSDDECHGIYLPEDECPGILPFRRSVSGHISSR